MPMDRLVVVLASVLVSAAVGVGVILFTTHPQEAGPGVLLILDKTELRGERSFSYTIVNEARGSISFGGAYDIQIRRGGEWVSVEWMRDRYWILILLRLKPGESLSRTVELPEDVEPGTYRLVKEVTLDDTGERITLTAEFRVVR